MIRPRRALAAGIFVAAVAITVAVVLTGLQAGRDFESNGERIYFTATNDAGNRIPSRAGPNLPPMHRLTCASCHGDDGKGGRVWIMMRRINAPDITWSTLRRTHTDEAGEGDHEEHLAYTEETLARAITDGLDPEGKRLASTMPRWQLSQRDLDDLLAYLETLDDPERNN